MSHVNPDGLLSPLLGWTTQGSAAPTSVDEQDVVLIDRPMKHLRVHLAGQQMLVEPFTAILEGLRGGGEQAFSLHGSQLITTFLNLPLPVSKHWCQNTEPLCCSHQAAAHLHKRLFDLVL